MKKLKAKIRDIRAEQPPLNGCLPMSESEATQGVTTAIQALQPQLAQEDLPQAGKIRWQRLAAQAERINQLSAQLEEAIFELKAIANDVNCDRRIVQKTQKPTKSVCEYLATVVPYVRYKKNGVFVLTTRPVDLFRAEREAVQVAQTIRRQARRRRVVSPLSRKNKHPIISWLT